MQKLNELVKDILRVNPLARDNDNFLYYKVIERVGGYKGIDINSMPLPTFFKHSSFYGFPPYESVSRARRKVQSENAELRANEYVKQLRQEQERKYHEFYSDYLNY